MKFTVSLPIDTPLVSESTAPATGCVVQSAALPKGTITILYKWDVDDTSAALTEGEQRFRLVYGIDWKDMEGSINISGGSVGITKDHADDISLLPLVTLPCGKFPDSSEGQLVESGWIQSSLLFDINVTLSFSLEGDLCTPPLTDLPRSCLSLLRPQSGSDVRIYFPLVGREIFTNSTVLATAAPFRFLSAFSGTKPANLILDPEPYYRDEISLYCLDDALLQYEDEDHTTDRTAWTETEVTPHSSVAASVHQITVQTFAFTTWLAVLWWIEVGTIQFAPLVTPGLGEKHRISQILYIALCHKEDKDFPPLASPIAVYRLAHFLEILPLRDIALRAIQSQLTTENVLHELLTTVSRDYLEIFKVEVDFVLDNWDELVESERMLELLDLASQDSWDAERRKKELIEKVRKRVPELPFDFFEEV